MRHVQTLVNLTNTLKEIHIQKRRSVQQKHKYHQKTLNLVRKTAKCFIDQAFSANSC